MFTITGKDISEKDFVDLHNYIFTKGDALYRINYTGCLLVNIEVIRNRSINSDENGKSHRFFTAIKKGL